MENKVEYTLNWMSQNCYMLLGIYFSMSAANRTVKWLMELLFLGHSDSLNSILIIFIKLAIAYLFIGLFFKKHPLK